jgi:hypothetical protein
MPMGIKTAPACFQRFIVETFNDFINRKVLQIYLDDFILNTETIEEHEEEGLKLFETMKQANIKCSKNKSEMVTQEVQFLGNTINNGNIYPSKNRANAINQKPQPQLLNELQAWLGTANYLRRYIKDYAEITQPLYQMMDLKNVPKHLRKKNGAPNGKKIYVKWTEQTNKCFEKLKETLCSNFVLALPDFTKEMILTTDASDKGYGAVLEQEFETNGIKSLQPLEYYSRSYTNAQKNYSTTEKELLAVVMAVEHFHTYLYGKKFIIYTDHLPNTLLVTKSNPHHRVERWMMRLQLYEFEMKYKPGNQNILADFLSRPQENEPEMETEEDYLDQLVANIETIGVKSTINYQIANNELYKQMELYDQIKPIRPPFEIEYIASSIVIEETEINNIDTIASEPSSSISNSYTSYAEEQNKDSDIQWKNR